MRGAGANAQLEKNTFLWYPAFLKFACETQQEHFFKGRALIPMKE
jgi:hypothetical protein